MSTLWKSTISKRHPVILIRSSSFLKGEETFGFVVVLVEGSFFARSTVASEEEQAAFDEDAAYLLEDGG